MAKHGILAHVSFCDVCFWIVLSPVAFLFLYCRAVGRWQVLVFSCSPNSLTLLNRGSVYGAVPCSPSDEKHLLAPASRLVPDQSTCRIPGFKLFSSLFFKLCFAFVSYLPGSDLHGPFLGFDLLEKSFFLDAFKHVSFWTPKCPLPPELNINNSGRDRVLEASSELPARHSNLTFVALSPVTF